MTSKHNGKGFSIGYISWCGEDGTRVMDYGGGEDEGADDHKRDVME